MNGEKRLQNKVCLITGASNGIGRAIATLFYEHGAKLALLDIESFDDTLLDIEAINQQKEENILCIKCDISDEQQIISSIKTIHQKYGCIDVIVNNAAHFIFHSVLTAKKEDWNNSLNVNVIGSANVIKHAVNNGLMKTKTGSIVNISSISAFFAQRNFTTYSITKAAILQMTRNTALDLYQQYGIRVNAICPGAVETRTTRQDYKNHVKNWKQDKSITKIPTYEEWKHDILAEIGIMKRFAKPREIAFAALFFASDESSFCTGSALLVDGGYAAL
eukprot:78218_1